MRLALEKAKTLGKEVEVKTIGGDTLLGLSQVEALMPPLEHGLHVLLEESAQTTAERMAAGKPAVNRMEIKAQEGEAKITLSISDDGRGMDLEYELRPGNRLFAIQRELGACGGSLEGQSWPGQGTLLAVEIPFTGDRFTVLGLQIGNDLYALPLNAVLEARRASGESVVHIDGRTYLSQNREIMPLFDLGSLLGKSSTATKDGYWLFVKTQEERFVLLVPVVLGPRQVAVKPRPSGTSIPSLTGACTDSAGRIYFMLSPEQLAKLAGKVRRFKTTANREADK
jgi:two-component system chemotaxis sensor kinase CheA